MAENDPGRPPRPDLGATSGYSLFSPEGSTVGLFGDTASASAGRSGTRGDGAGIFASSEGTGTGGAVAFDVSTPVGAGTTGATTEEPTRDFCHCWKRQIAETMRCWRCL